MKVLILDNYDSFTYNLYQLCSEICIENTVNFSIDVIRNDAISLHQILSRRYNRIIISPGPGDPSKKDYFGVCSQVLLKAGQRIPVLGVCLGMQGMAYCFGGRIIAAKEPKHGKTSLIDHDGKGLFVGLPQNLSVMRYHSLIADEKHLPTCLEVSARSKDTHEIMGLRHKKYPIEGVQFHPESFATEGGKEMIKNFLIK